MDVEAAIAEVIPPHELKMVVSEIGLNNDWSAAYSQNAGQQDAVIRLQLAPERSHSSQEYAVMLRKKLKSDPRFADLEISFDTGGMVSAALNFGASSPIDIQVTGGTPEQKFEAAAKIKNLVADVHGRGRRARPPAERLAVPDARSEPREGRRRSASPPVTWSCRWSPR